MNFVWLPVKASLILILSSIIFIPYNGFLHIEPAYSNKQNQKIKFTLPAPPPGRAVGGRSRGGGRRGPCPDVETNLTALVPFTQKTVKLGQTEHVKENVWGLTNSLRPQFPFYVPFTNKYSFPTEFLLQDEESKKIIYQSAVKLPSKPGIISVSLPETVKPLEANKNYRWFFNIYCEPQKPIPSLRVEGVVRRVTLSGLNQKINAAEPRKQVELYATEGIWFDTLNTLARLRQQEPENKELVETWVSLLESIGLSDIAKQSLVE
ncbi:hypothetical protein DSM106972_031520 [Dulcicalothrix desertica PCC 7102]|uniref:DUF928 domain-containing protein n=1 Tax=Dulcicalothrix desertica PCC 7102 TaxID=232991 RepID=A0A3S1J178_9CYAN|nr:DUF928 domain-containing protein [Dulcicalothrix desertica]RUT05946.1 hypothetical protein DSM106972_031520 [Dulcicalothrix desertica PCC 7102]TWH54424.1 uncharacterized protein DUF928 [Dulcicalothrix desertica PCC 7102]